MKVKVFFNALETTIHDAETGEEVWGVKTSVPKGCSASRFDKAGEVLDNAYADHIRFNRNRYDVVEKHHVTQGLIEDAKGNFRDA